MNKKNIHHKIKIKYKVPPKIHYNFSPTPKSNLKQNISKISLVPI